MKRTLALLSIAAALLGTAFAQSTAAGTSIRNQASATYLGVTTPVTSNEVFTVVQQVYSFTITPDGTQAAPGQTRNALPGAKVYFAYRITNTGNGTDSISLSTIQDAATDNFNLTTPTIYADGNCNGQLDPGESAVTSVSVDRLGAAVNYACVVVEGTIPASATSGNYGNLNLSGTSTGGSSDTNNWARAVATTAAALDINKSASPSGLVSPGATITYTINGQNRGGSAAAGTAGVVTVDSVASNGIFIQDLLPAGLTYVASSLSASAGAGTITKIYKTATGWTATEPAAASVTGVGILITGSGAFFPQNASYSMNFNVTVPSTATPADSYSNTATIYFNDNGTPTATDTNAVSSPAVNTVSASYNVALGPDSFPAGGASGTYTTSYTVTRSGDTQTVASAYTGTTVIFKQTLRNTGNTSDSFDLSLGTAPSGWTCQLVPSSGSGFISGSIGPVAANGTFDFQVHCAIAAGSTSASAQSITVTATSVSDNSKTDSTTDTVSAVVSGYSVDEAQRGNAGDGNAANDNFGSSSADPGTSIDYAIDVKNTGNTTDTYNMSASAPSGWTVVFYNDANNNGVLDTGETVVTSSGSLASGSTAHLIARVTVASGAAPSTGNTVTFTSTSTTLGSVTDSITATVDVNLVKGFTFTPDRNNTVTTPGTVTYNHTVQNTGNASATVGIGAYTSAFGWVYEFSTNGGSTWVSSVSGLTLAAGATATIQVRVQTPAGEPVGRFEAATFTATANYGSSSSTDSVTDTTTIIAGNLQLTKDWTLDGTSYFKGDGSDATTPPEVAPGNNITYRIVATNIGTADLYNVKVSDPLPANTDFVSVSATTSVSGGTVLYSTDGTAWSATAPTSLATGGSIYVAVDTDASGTITSADAMAPAKTITITFVVKVK